MARPAPEPTQAAFEAGLFFRSDPRWPAPDCQLIFGASAFGDFGRGPPEALTAVAALTRPMARGTVRLASADPLDAPLLDPGLLGEEGDVRRLAHAVAAARSVSGADPLRGWIAGPRPPDPALDPVEAVRANALSQWHMAGSCKMGQDRWAVVDPGLRVRGAERLRVVDSSVFPTVPSGNSQAACVMVAERASDLVRRAHGLPVLAA